MKFSIALTADRFVFVNISYVYMHPNNVLNQTDGSIRLKVYHVNTSMDPNEYEYDFTCDGLCLAVTKSW